MFSAQDSDLAVLALQTIDLVLTPPNPAACDIVQPTQAGSGAPFCQRGVWFQAAYEPLQANSSSLAPSFHADAARFVLGADGSVGTSGLRVGVAAGFDQVWLGDGDGGNATSQVARVIVYAAQPLGPAVLNAAISYGHDWDTTNRATPLGALGADHGGNEFAGGLQISAPLPLAGASITPRVGVRFAVLDAGSFTESGPGALGSFAVAGAGTDFSSVVPFARVDVARGFTTDAGIVLAPRATLGYDCQAGTVSPTVLLTALDGTQFAADHVTLDRSSAVLGVGLSAGRDNWALFAAYRANLAGNWTVQTVQAGVRMAF